LLSGAGGGPRWAMGAFGLVLESGPYPKFDLGIRPTRHYQTPNSTASLANLRRCIGTLQADADREPRCELMKPPETSLLVVAINEAPGCRGRLK
jgi:hypothetical protein